MALTLFPHPASPPSDPPFDVWASVDHAGAFGAMATTNIWFGIRAPADRFVIPANHAPGRADGLWQSTCFEAFLRGEGDEAYTEWNFAPSGDWAAYAFDRYRDGMCPVDVVPPYIRMEDNLTWWTLGATIAVTAGRQWSLGLSAVIEEKNGAKSYWALSHVDPEKPDFHQADCFTATLA